MTDILEYRKLHSASAILPMTSSATIDTTLPTADTWDNSDDELCAGSDNEDGGGDSADCCWICDCCFVDVTETTTIAIANSSSCSIKQFICSKPGRLLIFVTIILIVLMIYRGSFTSTNRNASDTGASVNFNQSRAMSVLNQLCGAYERGLVSGDLCYRLCFDRNRLQIDDFYESNKIVLVVILGGQQTVIKSLHYDIDDFDAINDRLSYDQFTDMVLDVINSQLELGWPSIYKKHLIETVWPMIVRTHGQLSTADRRSLWSLINQDEYLVFKVMPLSRVVPKVMGSCGHFYAVEHLVPFRMKGYYTNLKAKILVHLMGTLKLFYEFLNEPLQWCDVKFENFGLSADYPKRFLLMDGDLLFTESKMRKFFASRTCRNDDDCAFFDCIAQCKMTNGTHGYCSDRINDNVDVFCKKLVAQLFGNFWTKSNRYLAACHDKSINASQRLADLRLVWSWSLSDV